MHIVFDGDDAAALQKSFELDEQLASEILIVEDDWSIGPLSDFIEEEKVITRAEWLASLGIQLPEKDAAHRIKEHLNQLPESSVTLWVAPNSRDVCGYYKLVASLEEYKGRIFNIWLNNLPFINDKLQVFYPNFLKEILPAEFVKAKKLSLEISGATFETDPDEWNKLTRENDLLRISDGGRKVSGKPVNFFDRDIADNLQNDWQKISKVVNAVKSKSKHHPSKLFLLWRVREMISQQKLEARGDWPATENFEIRKPQADNQSDAQDE